MEYLGVDVGFGYTKAFNGERSIIFKSVIGDATNIQFHSGFSEGSALENLHITVDGLDSFEGTWRKSSPTCGNSPWTRTP